MLLLINGLMIINAFPFFLEYFNPIAGGSETGNLYVNDSNFDWEQDKVALLNYVEQNPNTYYDINMIENKGNFVANKEKLTGTLKEDTETNKYLLCLRDKYQSGELKPIDRINYVYLVFEIDKETLCEY
jgi:hypothetical protein